MKILVLGAGRMGLGAAYDLAHSADVETVTVADLEMKRAQMVVDRVGSRKLTATKVNAANYLEIIELMRQHDAAISCVVYSLNHMLARAAIEAKCHFCDLGGNNDVVAAELALDQQAREAGINIIPDCGLAPGMVSVLVAHGAARFTELEAIHIRVGGLPQQPKPPLNYQQVFAMEGLINEYIEPARVLRGGEVIQVDSMTELESLQLPVPYQQLEAFQTSGGTSTLPHTFLGRVKDLDYKTIRYPGHCEKFKLLLDLGLAGSEELLIGEVKIAPRKVLEELLRRRLPADEPDVVLIRIEFCGVENGQRERLFYTIIDKFDEKTGLSAMMRTTAFPASIIAQMMARSEIKERGAIPQECCVPANDFVAALAARNINIIETMQKI